MAAREATVTIACQHVRHFQVEDGATGVARVMCRNRRCKHFPDEVTIHHFDLATGELLTTRRYARPLRGDLDGAATAPPHALQRV